MGLFYNSIQKPGPGVKKDARKKNPFFLFWDIYFRKFWRMIQLNMLYVLFCLPIVTFGPATAAFTYVLRNFAREEHAFVWMDFRDAFKRNWKKGAVAGFLDFAVAFLAYVNIIFYNEVFKTPGQPIYLYAFCSVTLIALLLYVFMRPYIYTMIVTFDLSFSSIYKNAMLFSVMGLLRNFIATALGAVIVYYTLFTSFLEVSLVFILFITPVTISFVSIFATYPLIKKHMIDPRQAKPKGKDDEESIFQD